MIDYPLLIFLWAESKKNGFLSIFINDKIKAFIIQFLFSKPVVTERLSNIKISGQLCLDLFNPFLFLFF